MLWVRITGEEKIQGLSENAESTQRGLLREVQEGRREGSWGEQAGTGFLGLRVSSRGSLRTPASGGLRPGARSPHSPTLQLGLRRAVAPKGGCKEAVSSFPIADPREEDVP